MEDKGAYVALKMSEDGRHVILEAGVAEDEYAIQIDMSVEDCLSLMQGLKDGIERVLEKGPQLTVIKGGKDDTVH